MKEWIWPIFLVIFGSGLLLVLLAWMGYSDFDLAAGLMPWVLPSAMTLLVVGVGALLTGAGWVLFLGVRHYRAKSGG